MAETKRMARPKLKIDEVLLLVDTYFRLKKIPDRSQKKVLIQELSDAERALPFFPEYRDLPWFRSFSGMSMCLNNVAHLDPECTTEVWHRSKLQRRVFEYYVNKQDLLHNIAEAIKRITKLSFPLLPKYQDNIMGQMLPSYYEYLEQNHPDVVGAAKVIMARGRTECAICGMDLEEIYPGSSQLLLEPHLTLDVNRLNGREEISLSDIVFLCPTCHKLAHSEPERLTETTLKALVKGR